MPTVIPPPRTNPITDEEMRTKLRYIDSLNGCISTAVEEIERSDHPKGKEIAATLRENYFDNAAHASDCMIPEGWGKWYCPACGETHEDPESRTVTSCGHCHITVLLSEVDDHNRREAYERK